MSILSNIDIEDFFNSHNIPFVGVFPSDMLPKRRKNGAYVLNLADHDQPGTHWTGFVIRNKKCFYFDSFATPPPQEVLHLCRDCTHIYYNNVQIQANTDVCCGWYVIAFIHFAQYVDDPITSFVKMFHHGSYLQENVQILRNYIQQKFSK